MSWQLALIVSTAAFAVFCLMLIHVPQVHERRVIFACLVSGFLVTVCLLEVSLPPH